MIPLTFVIVAILLVPVIAAAPVFALVLAGGTLLVVLTALWPVGAVIGFIALNPLLTGLGRGAVIPYLRLNEGLLAIVLCGLVPAVLRRWARAGWRLPRGGHALDLAVLAFAFTSSVSPLLWMYARARDITVDDLMYALTPWKLALFYAVVRLFLRDLRAVRWALGAVLVSAGVLGVIGVLQAVGVGPVIDALTALVPPEENGYDLAGNRATATLGNPIAYGDVMIYATVIAAALALRLPGRGRLLWAAAAVLGLFALASGQASVLVGLVVAGIAFAVATGTVPQAVLVGVSFAAVGLQVLQPVLAARLDVTDPQTGLPNSWTGPYGRLANLERYFWPPIGTDFNWLFGVQTAGRVPDLVFRGDWVYIESGYTWALWTGGVPLLLAVLLVLVVAARRGTSLAAVRQPVVGAVGISVTTVAWAVAVLMLFDPHLTLRGGAELLILLLALAATLDVAHRRAVTTGSGAGAPSAGPAQRDAEVAT
ncbi:hypothetical protein ACI789_04430 [Geodermatophilus sp. SYSU D00965]